MTDNDSMKGGEIDIMSLIFVVLQVISYDFNFPLIFETLEKYSLENTVFENAKSLQKRYP